MHAHMVVLKIEIEIYDCFCKEWAITDFDIGHNNEQIFLGD